MYCISGLILHAEEVKNSTKYEYIMRMMQDRMHKKISLNNNRTLNRIKNCSFPMTLFIIGIRLRIPNKLLDVIAIGNFDRPRSWEREKTNLPFYERLS